MESGRIPPKGEGKRNKGAQFSLRGTIVLIYSRKIVLCVGAGGRRLQTGRQEAQEIGARSIASRYNRGKGKAKAPGERD